MRAPFSANNTIDPALFSKAAVAIAKKLPAAQDQCGKVTYGLVNKPNELQAVGKVDYQRNASHSIFGRYLATTLSVTDPYTLSNNLLTTTSNGWDNLAQSYALGDTYLFGPNTVNALRLTVNRVALHRAGPHFFGPQDVGINAYSSLPDNLVITITGGPSMGSGTNSEATFRTTAYQLADDVSIVQGGHQWAFGANIAQWRTNQYAYRAALGTYNFNGAVTGLGMGDFLTGKLNTLLQGSPTSWGDRQTVFATYVADTWKVTPKLTFNYGMRWEPFLPLRLTQGAVYGFDQKRFDQRLKSTVYPGAPAGFYFPGDPGFPKKVRSTPSGSMSRRASDLHGICKVTAAHPCVLLTESRTTSVVRTLSTAAPPRPRGHSVRPSPRRREALKIRGATSRAATRSHTY